MAKQLAYQVIADARALIAEEHHWIQGIRSIDCRRRRVEPEDPTAARFCAIGALHRAAFDLSGDSSRAHALVKAACDSLIPDDRYSQIRIEDINDRQGHTAVLDLFKKALAT